MVNTPARRLGEWCAAPAGEEPRADSSMESLVALASSIEVRTVALPGGGEAAIRSLPIRFSRATPDRLKPGTLAATYVSKPLVSVDGDAMFGELAIARWLEKDGWQAFWVDTFHRQQFWRVMPHRGRPAVLPEPLRGRYDAIVAANGGRPRGFFDVIAARGDQVIHLEYKDGREGSNRTEADWIESALRAGVSEHDLWFVVRPDPG